MTLHTATKLLLNPDYRYLKSYRYRALNPKRVEHYLYSTESDAELLTRLEQEMAAHTKRDFAIVTGSGNHSFSLAVEYLQHQNGNDFLLQSYICKNLAHILHAANARIELVDIDPKTFNLPSPKSLTKKKRTIVGVHSFGNPIDVKAYADYCTETKSVLIEDCAHALGVKKKGKFVGNTGWVSLFSFRKNIFSGSGGALAFDDPKFHSFIQKKMEKRKTQSPERDRMGKMALFWKKTLPTATWPYVWYSRYEYGGMRVLEDTPTRMDLAVTLTQLETIGSFNEQARANAHSLTKQLGQEMGKEDKDENGYCRFLIPFQNTSSAQAFYDEATELGYETGMNYARDFYMTTKLIGANPSRYPNSQQAAEKVVPIGLFNLDAQHIADLASLIRKHVTT